MDSLIDWAAARLVSAPVRQLRHHFLALRQSLFGPFFGLAHFSALIAPPAPRRVPCSAWCLRACAHDRLGACLPAHMLIGLFLLILLGFFLGG